jgi:uncharacterized membrane protein YdjX (TVP38/TMEM64 family)
VSLVLSSCGSIPTAQGANDAVLTLRQHESWAWALGIALIRVDVVLPVPQTAMIAALGIIYGTLLGALLGSLGLITGGLLGYVLFGIVPTFVWRARAEEKLLMRICQALRRLSTPNQDDHSLPSLSRIGSR